MARIRIPLDGLNRNFRFAGLLMDVSRECW